MNYYGIPLDDKYLKHYGITGMKWGVRRYQNPDGSLTDAGRKRYRKETSGLSSITARYNKIWKDIKEHMPEDYKKINEAKKDLAKATKDVLKEVDKIPKIADQLRGYIDAEVRYNTSMWQREYDLTDIEAKKFAARQAIEDMFWDDGALSTAFYYGDLGLSRAVSRTMYTADTVAKRIATPTSNKKDAEMYSDVDTVCKDHAIVGGVDQMESWYHRK